MKKIMEMLQNMKAKNEKKDNKGFSLVELIIVIAIMAILVGVVGTQVLPYLNKSKLEKDRQIVSSYSTAAVSAYSMLAGEISAIPTEDIIVYGTGAPAESTDAGKIVKAIKELTYSACPTAKFKSKECSGATTVKIKFNTTDNTVTATVEGTGANKAAISVTSDM